MAERDAVFKEQFCHKGSYIGTDGQEVEAVTCSVNAVDYLQFMHDHDEKILGALEMMQ